MDELRRGSFINPLCKCISAPSSYAVRLAREFGVTLVGFLRMAKRAESVMPHGGTLVCMSYYGAERVVGNYNLMGPVKAALETATGCGSSAGKAFRAARAR